MVLAILLLIVTFVYAISTIVGLAISKSNVGPTIAAFVFNVIAITVMTLAAIQLL